MVIVLWLDNTAKIKNRRAIKNLYFAV